MTRKYEGQPSQIVESTLSIKETFKVDIKNVENISPILKSKFRQLQETGKEAELFFINNFKNFHKFREGSIQDARLFGDGYDFQIKVLDRFFQLKLKDYTLIMEV